MKYTFMAILLTVGFGCAGGCSLFIANMFPNNLIASSAGLAGIGFSMWTWSFGIKLLQMARGARRRGNNCIVLHLKSGDI